MQESKKIFLVCTPEIPSLHQAREKLTFLREYELESRVAIILNRVGRKPLFTEKQVAELVGAPVVWKFPNDYVGVYRALTEGTLIDPASELGKSFTDFAESLFHEKPLMGGLKNEVKRKFLEFLAVAPEGERAATEG
jgi:Flp pilus assembly CpaE family ATPase